MSVLLEAIEEVATQVRSTADSSTFAIVGNESTRKSGHRVHVITMDQKEVKAAFLRTYDTYADDIYRFCVLKVSNREQAEDLTQEVFMRFWQTLRNGTELKNERAFLYTLARNLVIDWYRKKKDYSLDSLTEQGFDFGGDDHHLILRSAEVREVLEVVNQLDDDSRDALILRFVEGFTPKEIAALSGESANAVSVRINRAIKKVQAIIQSP